MRTKPTLMLAASSFVITAVLFAAAMIVASSLSIPDPAKRFLPPSARGLPSEQTSEHVELANDNRIGPALDEPMPEVTAVPEPPAGDLEPPLAAGAGATLDPAGSAVSSSSDTVAEAAGDRVPFTPSTGGTRSTPGPYTGPGWPSWGGPTTPATPATPEPAPSESEPPEPEPSEGSSTESLPTEPAPSQPTTEPPTSESATPAPHDTRSPSASEGVTE